MDTDRGFVEHWTDAIPDAYVYQLLASAQRIARRRTLAEPTWSAAKDVFCVGSGYAWSLCKRARVDPDSTFRKMTRRVTP